MTCGICGQALTAERSFGLIVTVIQRDGTLQRLDKQIAEYLCSHMCAHAVVARGFQAMKGV